jgi:hypothetical protein
MTPGPTRIVLPALVLSPLLAVVFVAAGARAGVGGGDAQAGAAFAAGPAAFEALAQRLGAPLNVLRVVFDAETVEIDAQDPRQPMHVNRYRYEQGRLDDGEPVPVGRNQRQLEARLFRPEKTDLARLPGLLLRALSDVNAEDGEISHVILERDEHQSWVDDRTILTRPLFRVHVSGPRNGGYVEFRLDGTRGRVVRW